MCMKHIFIGVKIQVHSPKQRAKAYIDIKMKEEVLPLQDNNLKLANAVVLIANLLLKCFYRHNFL